MPDHYYTKNPESELKTNEIKANLRGHKFSLITASSVFAVDRVDHGTNILIENCIVEDGSKVLDLGCGIGVVGIVIKKIYPECEVVQTDVNERAVMITKKNCQLNHVKTTVFQSDLFENIKDKFDCILLNPPQTAGKQICFRMIEESYDHLNSGGNLQIVARHSKGGEHLSEKMKSVFGNCESIAKQSGFRVYLSSRL